MSLHQHVPHPQVLARRAEGPQLAAAEHTGLNGRLAIWITAAVGSMACAYLFALLALVGLPAAIQAGPFFVVVWISSTFLQLVLLPVIMVGQAVQGRVADKRALQTYQDTEAILYAAADLATHLGKQDALLAAIAAAVQSEPKEQA